MKLKNLIHQYSFVRRTGITVAGVLAAGVFGGCTWVKLDPEAENVRTLYASEAASCQRLGITASKSMSKVGFVNRSQEKLKTELNTLARNEAAKMGGNAIVAKSDVEEGSQRFIVYRCP
ncbi:MAG: DUF4156 domain-containing protein [Exilibacterium sp.]